MDSSISPKDEILSLVHKRRRQWLLHKKLGADHSQIRRTAEDADANADAAERHAIVSSRSFIEEMRYEQLTCWEDPKTQISFTDAFIWKKKVS
jgi:hypothetical protein